MNSAHGGWNLENVLSDIIESYRGNVRSHYNLLKEVENLHSEVSSIRKNRNVLLETVDHLNKEIRQFNAYHSAGASPRR